MARLEFIKAVGPGQTVTVDSEFMGKSLLIIDHPKTFAGEVVLQPNPRGLSDIDLNHLAGADSYSYQNDILSIYKCNKVIDTLNFHANTMLTVVNNNLGGVTIYNADRITSQPPSPAGSVLPVHS